MSGGGGVKPDNGAWLGLVERYSVGVFRGREVFRARLRPELQPSDPEVRDALDAWTGSAYLDETAEGVELVLVRSAADAEPTRWWLHVLLFLLTVFTTHMAGALLLGLDPLGTRFMEIGSVALPYPTTVEWAVLARGWIFGVPFMAVLLGHEAGHWLMARRHRIEASPPYFIPFPAYYSIVGTLGAFIRIRSPMVRRPILLDVGAGGPVASFLLSIPLVLVGLSLSRSMSGVSDLLTPYVVRFAGQTVWIGNGAAFHLLATPFFPDTLGHEPVVLHPVAFAGWLGLFLTALNLLPLGQLDGGHVLYALARKRQHRIGRLFLLSLLPLGILWWGWWLWAVAAFAVNRGRMGHPPLLQEGPGLDRGRAALAWACVIVFFLTFVPVPLRL